MATHSSVLAWRIQGRGSLVGCRLWGRTELDTTEVTQQQQQQQSLQEKLLHNVTLLQCNISTIGNHIILNFYNTASVISVQQISVLY